MPSAVSRAALFTLVSISAAACHEQPREAARAALPAAPRPVKVAVVSAGAAGGHAVPAGLRARDRATLSARVPASVRALPFREGEHVRAGAIVARLEDSALRSALAAAEAALASAQADEQRAQSLFAYGASTQREVEQAHVRAAAAQAAVQQAKEGLSYAVLRAPFAGVIAARPVHVGDVVSPGASVIVVEREGALEVWATLNATEAAGVTVGQELRAKVDGQPIALPVKVRSLSRAADPSTHRFEVRADLPEGKALRSGLFARLLLPSGGESTALPTVPQSALFARGGLTGVYVVDGAAARLRWIAVGQPSGDSVEVRAGLSTGEKVALDPAGLEDGAPVQVQ
jgi:RND family efflux transporter MFP subunit